MAFASVIKYEGDYQDISSKARSGLGLLSNEKKNYSEAQNNYELGKTIVWKYPEEDFNSTTQLIVHESQEAIFLMNGQALDLFGPGRYTLETQNIPLIGKLLHLTTGGENPFHCEVYFINKVEQMSIKWGTPQRVEYIEPTYGFPISIGASGEMTFSVSDARKLLVKVVGVDKYLNSNQLSDKLKVFLFSKLKTYIAKKMKELKISIFEIDEHILDFSDEIKAMLVNDFLDYGVSLEKFTIVNFAKPEDDPTYKKFKDLYFRQYADIAEAKLKQNVDVIKQETEAKKVVIDSEAQAKKRQLEGYTYQQEQGFKVARDLAQNEAKGEWSNLGIGLGTMAGVGGAMGGYMGNVMKDTLNNSQNASMITCPNCGTQLPNGSKFCNNCGHEIKIQVAKMCPKCNTEVPAGSKFCNNCGTKID